MGNRSVGYLLCVLALTLLILPLQWVFAAIVAATFHEGCHYLAVRLCGGQVRFFAVGISGAKMQISPLSPGKELFCALAGPFGSLSLLLIAQWLPKIAICAGLQGLYNLLPIYPLDGGRAVRCLTELIFPYSACQTICVAIEYICITGMVMLALYAAFALKLGLLPLVVASSAVMRRFPGKIPCKLWGNSVQ